MKKSTVSGGGLLGGVNGVVSVDEGSYRFDDDRLSRQAGADLDDQAIFANFSSVWI